MAWTAHLLISVRLPVASAKESGIANIRVSKALDNATDLFFTLTATLRHNELCDLVALHGQGNLICPSLRIL